jgi:hypothetical protein
MSNFKFSDSHILKDKIGAIYVNLECYLTQNIQLIIILICNQHKKLLMSYFFCTKSWKSNAYFISATHLNSD